MAGEMGITTIRGIAPALINSEGSLGLGASRDRPTQKPNNLPFAYRLTGPEFAFPDHQNVPSKRSQEAEILPIPLGVSGDLLGPVIGISLWESSTPFAVMPVPEASLHEDCSVQSREDQIWFAREILRVQTEPISQTVNKSAHLHLRCSIFRPHRTHCCATLRVNRLFARPRRS